MKPRLAHLQLMEVGFCFRCLGLRLPGLGGGGLGGGGGVLWRDLLGGLPRFGRGRRSRG